MATLRISDLPGDTYIYWLVICRLYIRFLTGNIIKS